MPAGRARSRRGNGHAPGNSGGGRERAGERAAAAVQAPWAGTPRNAACPCGSGKKFKHCHGRI
jgi:preprotein translocase subunit SecA